MNIGRHQLAAVVAQRKALEREERRLRMALFRSEAEDAERRYKPTAKDLAYLGETVVVGRGMGAYWPWSLYKTSTGYRLYEPAYPSYVPGESRPTADHTLEFDGTAILVDGRPAIFKSPYSRIDAEPGTMVTDYPVYWPEGHVFHWVPPEASFNITNGGFTLDGKTTYRQRVFGMNGEKT